MPVKIKVTNNADIFKSLPGNRQINWGHVAKLEKAMGEKDYLCSLHPILVNKNFEIIDGQHRLEALKRLKMPIYYLQGQDLRLEDVQMLNAFSKNWTPHDFALSYAKLGFVEYVVYLDLLAKYRLGKNKLKHEALLLYMTQSKSNTNDDFRKGKLQLVDENLTRFILDQLLEVAASVGDDGRAMGKIFCMAFYSLCRNPKYDHKHMISKMRKFGEKMGKYVTVQDCLRELENIYNHFTPLEQQIKAY